MDWTTIGALIARHSLTTAGGWLAANGFLPSGTTTEAFVGAGMTLLGVVWSVWQKADHAKVVAELEAALSHWQARGTGKPAPPGQKP
jgi:hypothetical protein